mmetsp:Transcript_8178/g.24129  ORF Transcript_8178/g.24129 Transcript_8178/m.24129 type:complete len:220 (+) Transcript_8178:331-990(+)
MPRVPESVRLVAQPSGDGDRSPSAFPSHCSSGGDAPAADAAPALYVPSEAELFKLNKKERVAKAAQIRCADKTPLPRTNILFRWFPAIMQADAATAQENAWCCAWPTADMTEYADVLESARRPSAAAATPAEEDAEEEDDQDRRDRQLRSAVQTPLSDMLSDQYCCLLHQNVPVACSACTFSDAGARHHPRRCSCVRACTARVSLCGLNLLVSANLLPA